MKAKSTPVCSVCDKPISLVEYVEISASLIRGETIVPLGSQLYHAECYLDGFEEDNEKDGEEK